MSNSQTTARSLRVLIVEDHELARYGLSMSLSERENIAIVGEAENGEQGVEQAIAEKPDIVLMDIGMPVMNGITATQRIKSQDPNIKVVMLTSMSNQEEVLASLAAGADAYCMKEIKLDRLAKVLEMVMDGAIWLDPMIARLVIQSLPGGSLKATEAPSEKQPKRRYNTQLTDREQEVLKLIVSGKSNKEIAQLLGVSNHTAKAHVGNIIQKLAVDDRTQVAVKALQEGLL